MTTINEVRIAIKAMVNGGDVVKGVVAYIESCIVKSLNPKGIACPACYPFGSHCSEGLRLILQYTAASNKNVPNKLGFKQQFDWIPYACNAALNQEGYGFDDLQAKVNETIDKLYQIPWSQGRKAFRCSDKEWEAFMKQAKWMKAVWWEHQVETYNLSSELMWTYVKKHIRAHLQAHTDVFSKQAYDYLTKHGYQANEAVKVLKTEVSKEAFANAELLRSLGL